jgi:hypothetical protein
VTQNLTTAVESTNKGELFTSFDVDAFEVPHGRDELWRFTPLRRLRGLHDGSAPATGSGVTATPASQPATQTAPASQPATQPTTEPPAQKPPQQ